MDGYIESVNVQFLQKIIQCQQEINFKYKFWSFIPLRRNVKQRNVTMKLQYGGTLDLMPVKQ